MYNLSDTLGPSNELTVYVDFSQLLNYWPEEKGQELDTNLSCLSLTESGSDAWDGGGYAEYKPINHYPVNMHGSNPPEKGEAQKRPSKLTTAVQDASSITIQPLQIARDFWTQVNNVPSIVRGQMDRRSRSVSAPASQTESRREDQQDEKNSTGSLQPTEVYKRKSNQSGGGASCSTCPNRPTSSGYILSNNGLCYDPMRPQTPGPPEERGFDLSYEKWLRMQKQQQIQLQQQLQQGPSSNGNWQCKDQTYEKFEPPLNSTMNAGRQPCTRSSCGQLRAQQQKQQPQQQQQQPQQQPQQQLPQQAKHSCCQNADPNQSQAYSARPMAQRPSAAAPCQVAYPQRQQAAGSTSCAPIQRDCNDSYDTTTYMQLPQAQQRAPYMRGPVMQGNANVTFFDTNPMSSTTNRTQQSCAACSNDSWQGTTQNSFMPIMNSTQIGQPYGQQAPGPSLGPGASPTSDQKPLRVTPFVDDSTPEQRYIQRTNTLFFNALVMDQTCPGIIQNSLNDREDFNDYAFDIAFAGNIPDKPYPIDPITMIEAIKMRIDYEREEIRKKCPFYDPDDKDDSKKGKSKYYTGQRRKGSSSDKSKNFPYNTINRHFCSKNRSEVNDGVLAFLKAEDGYLSEPDKSALTRFSANINAHESNFFGLPIKMKIYNATTWPTS
ncbi:probable basic-leucine zipper transcription factor Q isoform X2 [Drosophila mojavensis]|uniref:probable basic-leucine zipper transcription factor Q isoform X2 n=1 Tax=Drosophila mojavensis TaxID=7230 RepID=UPI0013EE71D5|nr:probable basic-leucine zipper transcription factor Q isoform X2 [Drosophila mojavensis]